MHLHVTQVDSEEMEREAKYKLFTEGRASLGGNKKVRRLRG